MLGQDRPDKNLANCLIRGVEIPNPQQTSIYKKNDSVMKAERGALFGDSNPLSGRSVHNTAGYTWRATANRQIRTHLVTDV